ncbi:CRAL-TRIO domain-containing protein [Crucibulum laeve]|uniref:CRAL-TRIO domain-containing protein n=1 Tax=Crucibulum laeve TaxID=68775 RepID=A0A5C3MHZ2_9AGAR|nr:CRAL-TRIO domain-containing protein [Crucibulum laeve]
MDIQNRLQANHDKLLETYHANIEDILNLQDTLIHDILPSVNDELQLGPDAAEWAKQWLCDTSSIFRISRRNKFTNSFALESIRKNLIWRLSSLWNTVPLAPMANVHCLPNDVRDPFGRPILVIGTTPMVQSPEESRRLIIALFEQLRIHLTCLHERSTNGDDLPLQYVVLVDLKGLSMQSIDIDLMSWMLREVVPRFPGMLAGVFMLNYSWIHSGMWAIVKRLLPESALSRVFFPSQAELARYFTPSALPEDYGGSLPCLTHLEDPLAMVYALTALPASVVAEGRRQSADSSPSPFLPPVPSIATISPTSLLNPFFGYPVSSSTSRSSLSLHHGRRRKRDLAQTLALLFWIRWKKHITFGLFILTCLLVIRLNGRRLGRIINDIARSRAFFLLRAHSSI